MKITGSQIGSVNSVQLEKLKKSAPTSSAEATPQTDRFEHSKDASAINAARQVIAETPEIREDKVNLLRQQIAEGTYHAPAEQIADRLLSEGRLSKLGRI